MEEEDRRQNVADALRSVLEDGESYNVYSHDGEVWVQEVGTSVCAARHPRLYGRLLSLSAQLDNVASGMGGIPLLIVCTLCVGIRLRWWEPLVGEALLDHVDSVWFFLLLLLAFFQAMLAVRNRLARRLYQTEREELLAQMAAEKLDRDTLLAMIESDGAVYSAANQLKLDRDAARRTA